MLFWRELWDDLTTKDAKVSQRAQSYCIQSLCALWFSLRALWG